MVKLVTTRKHGVGITVWTLLLPLGVMMDTIYRAVKLASVWETGTQQVGTTQCVSLSVCKVNKLT